MLLCMHTLKTHTDVHKPTFQAPVPICHPLSTEGGPAGVTGVLYSPDSEQTQHVQSSFNEDPLQGALHAAKASLKESDISNWRRLLRGSVSVATWPSSQTPFQPLWLCGRVQNKTAATSHPCWLSGL